ncbi:hypothetical protein GOBAR_DD22871 [Gossypium barbadense]|nr:hypothetical protein GOBAR_DD22871 [Gossypium barbadense]
MVTTYWAIWYMRNRLVHEGLRWTIHEMVGFVQGEASTAAHALAGEGRRYQEAVYWIEKDPYVVDQIVAEDWVQWYAEEWIAIRSFVAWRNSILYSMEVIKAFSL